MLLKERMSGPRELVLLLLLPLPPLKEKLCGWWCCAVPSGW
jgi:hypothetical protein